MPTYQITPENGGPLKCRISDIKRALKESYITFSKCSAPKNPKFGRPVTFFFETPEDPPVERIRLAQDVMFDYANERLKIQRATGIRL